jgi:hypothetical protein
MIVLLTKCYAEDQFEMNEMDGTCSMGKMMGAYRVLVRRPEGKRPLGRPRHRWEDSKIYHQKVGWEDMACIDLAKNWNWK